MRTYLAAFCVAIAIFAGTPAHATTDSRVFPPDNETGCADAGAKFLSWYSGAIATHCSTGQDVLNNALLSNNQSCAANQVVTYDGAKFVCRPVTNAVPTCQANEFLSFDGTTYTCKSTGVVTCGDNQVLTFNGSSYFCVNKDATIPTCEANQFLTYNGSYHCAAVNAPVVPNCAAGQYVAGNGQQLYCAQLPALQTVIVHCSLEYVDAANDSWGCTATCPDGYTVTGGGFSAPGVAEFGNGHYSRPDGNGWISNVGRILSCTTGSPPCAGDPSGYAVCMKNFP